jgi:hypothetical protein
MERTRRQKRRTKKLFDILKKKNGYWKLMGSTRLQAMNNSLPKVKWTSRKESYEMSERINEFIN